MKINNQKVKRLSKKLRYKSNKRKETFPSNNLNTLQRSKTQETVVNILKSNLSQKCLQNNSKKLYNLISNLKHEIKIKDNDISKEKELREKFKTENKLIQNKLTQITRSKNKEVNELKKKLKESYKKTQAFTKPSVLSNNSKYSRNNNCGSINFSVFTQSFKTESNISNKGLDICQRDEIQKMNTRKEFEDSNVCQK